MQRSHSLRPMEASGIGEVRDLARVIWRQHYVTILSSDQIEYMLRDKYTEAGFARYFSATDKWFDVLRVNGVLSGFLRTTRASVERFKLEKIYLSIAVRGQGYGRLLLERADSLARKQGCGRVFLYVNRANARSIAAYQRPGYVIAQSEVLEIGNSFVMDDHLVEKSLDS